MKTVLLIDTGAAGHRLMYMRVLSLLLLQSGKSVVCFIPRVNEVESWIREKNPSLVQAFAGVEYHQAELKYNIATRFGVLCKGLYRWYALGKSIKKAEQHLGVKVDMVFFNGLDCYLSSYLSRYLLDCVFPHQWSGLLLQTPDPYRDDVNGCLRDGRLAAGLSPLASGNCRHVALLDENAAALVQRIRPGLPAFVMPDFTDETMPAGALPQADAIRKGAAGRIVVGILGMEKRKGVLNMIRLARQADAGAYYFVFAGRLYEQTFSGEDLILIKSFFSSGPENCLYLPDQLADEGAYNGIFNALDVVFLVYENFRFSSNALTKAAVFEKFVLATNRYCIGSRTKQYVMGETVAEGDIDMYAKALERLRHKLRDPHYDHGSNCRKYLEAHGPEKLRAVMNRMFPGGSPEEYPGASNGAGRTDRVRSGEVIQTCDN